MLLLASASLAALPGLLDAYPLDGYEETGIRRVEGSKRAHEGLAEGGFQPPGALWSTEAVDLRLLDHADMELPEPDPAFTRQVVSLLGDNVKAYGMALLDLSDPENPAYAEYRGDYRQNVGSVGKIIGAVGLFEALADAWPGDLERRKSILRDTVMTADDFSRGDEHDIRLFTIETNELNRRPMKEGDQGNLWEFLDWMLSVSSNAAAAMVMRDAMLLRHFGKQYPVSEQQIDALFAGTTASELTRLFQQTFWEPVTRNGLELHHIRQGSFFTAQGKKNVNGGGNSYATAHSLMQLMMRLEQGRLVDEWSSRQLKRLLYLTERRSRYASSPALREAAVYFKSGSWYRCRQEAGFECGKYRGNLINYMNSVAIVEEETEGKSLHYIVVIISNVLRENSAKDHQVLATAVHELIRQRNGVD
jgi:hypothetical protein